MILLLGFQLFNLIFVVLFIVLGSTAKNLWMVIALVALVIVLGYIFFRYNYNYTALKQKIVLKKKVDKITRKKGPEEKKKKKKKKLKKKDEE